MDVCLFVCLFVVLFVHPQTNMWTGTSGESTKGTSGTKENHSLHEEFFALVLFICIVCG